MARRNWAHYTRLILSWVGVIVGLSASANFAIGYKSPQVAAWAFASGVFAAVCCMLHTLYHKDILAVWHTPHTLQSIQTLGVIVLLVGYASMVWYLFIGFYHHEGINPPSQDSPYLCAVWSFMTAKWGTFIVIYSRMYIKIILTDVPLHLDF